ncbi:hypothetical protein HBI24_009020 [Parastagonospora nodorum]|nr:hypothetical protein HBI24_009020 [Parastagonospora nodorum]
MHTSLIKARSSRERQELEARHSLLNLSVHDLVKDSSNLSITTRCANSSGLLQSTIKQRNYSLRLSCLIRLQH